MHQQPKKRILLCILCAALTCALIAAVRLAGPHPLLTPEPQDAIALLNYGFPYTDATPFATAASGLANTLFGFSFFEPSSILNNQFVFCSVTPHTQAPVPEPSTNPPTPTTPAGTLPIAETTQTVAALKNTEGSNKQIYIDNDTSYDISIAHLMQEPLKLNIASDTPSVLIVHTHTTESYTPDGQLCYSPADTTRTQDKTQNVVRVGEEIAHTLTEKGINVLHDTTINDYPSYNGSYTKTLGIIEWYLQRYPSIRVVLDVHRDGMTQSDGTKLKLTANLQNDKPAQVMLVIGTNEGGLSHNDWRENLKLGLHIQDKLTTMYPSLARPLNLRKERFNQHATTGSMIVEVGSDGNTLPEAILAGRYFANALAEVLITLK